MPAHLRCRNLHHHAPAGGTPLAFDLGDVDRTTPAEWDLQLTLYTGRAVTLRQFGAAFSDLSRELLAAWRDRTVRCLLLEDLEELGRYQGLANGTPAEIRICKSNLAVLRQAGTPIQWRLAEVGRLHFDNAAHSIVLTRGAETLTLSKLAKKTDEAFGTLNTALTELREHAATVLHGVFPFLNADQLARLLQALPEGTSAPLPALDAIHPKLSQALIARAVDEPFKPYFDALRGRATADPLMAGFKFIRPEEVEPPEPDEASQQQPAETDPVFFWFFSRSPATASRGRPQPTPAARLTCSVPSRQPRTP